MDKNEYISNFDNLILNPQTRKIYGKQEFFNVGYWLADTQEQESACFNLMEKLLEFIPEKQGNILDVGCGLGATTNYLLRYYSSDDVVGINISPQQIERCQINAPQCKFLCMDAVEMEFADDSFDNIICVEAALYFKSREKFLQEAWRVLKPGGYLSLSDIIFEDTQYLGDWIVPQNNIVKNKDIEEYKKLYKQAGFEIVELLDFTDDCWKQHSRFLKSWLAEEFQNKAIDEETYQLNASGIETTLTASYMAYLLVSAKKPER